ncbi:MAG TPA: S9 family peptidase [Thermoanaerobaculia bacterium]|jgi:dipeptidyl aminopeptidase/acylaminoacyl peptidase
MRFNAAVAALAFAALPLAADDLETAVSRMSRVGFSRSPSFSPDGKTVAFVSNLSGLPQVWTVPAAGGFPRMVTSFDDPVGGVEWSPDGTWIAFSLAPGGGMNVQIYLVKPDGTGLRRLTDGGKETNRLGNFRHDGKRLVLGSNRRTGIGIDAYVYDMEDGRLDLVSENQGTGGFEDLSRDGKRALLNRLRYRGSNDLHLVDLATKKETLLTPHEGPGTYFGALSPDGNTVWISSNGGRDKLAFGRIVLGKDGAPGPIEIVAARDDAELQSFAIDDKGEKAVLVWNASGRHEMQIEDLLRMKVLATPKLPGDLVSGVTWTRDGRALAMTVSSATAPPDLFLLEEISSSSSSPRFTRITDSPHPGVDLSSLVSPELLKFKAHDGEPLSGWLYRPKGAKGPGPVVLSFHGGPEGQEVPSFRADYQALLSQGIAVFAPNVRGSSGFGKRFVNLDNGALRVNAVKDIVSCVDAVVKAGVGDPKRIGIMGGSYGGYMTMAGLVDYPDLFAAGADLFGVVNFRTFFKHTEAWMAAISKVEYGDPATEGELLDRLSPLTRIDRVKAPTLVLHGANDTNVPVIEAEQVVGSLKKRGVPVEYVLFPDEGHGFQKLPNRIRSNVALVKWFARWLGAAR